jgi:hypothetical protein
MMAAKGERHDLAMTTLRPPENPTRRVSNNFRAPRPVGSGYGDMSSPLSTPTIARHTYKTLWPRVSAEARARNKAARWTRDKSGEGTGGGRTGIHVPGY